jgi:hypothetical protein
MNKQELLAVAATFSALMVKAWDNQDWDTHAKAEKSFRDAMVAYNKATN